MDTLTHALSGMLLARATAPAPTTNHTDRQLSLKARLWTGFFAAAFPDIDFIARFIGPLTYLEHHRGITHSVLMLPIWALLLSWLLMRVCGGRYHWTAFFGVILASIGIHIVGDVITAFGTMILAPLSYAKFALPSTFIIDVYFTGIILTGLIISFLYRTNARQVAIVAMLVLSGYVGVQNIWHTEAIELAQNQADKLGLKQAKIYALPQPVSPLNWKLIIEDKDTYYIAFVNLYRKQSLPALPGSANMLRRVNTLYQPVSDLKWEEISAFPLLQGQYKRESKDIWQITELQKVREFMYFPALAQTEQRQEGLCYWFEDHRFVLPGIRSPFNFGVCSHNLRDWTLYRKSSEHIIAM